MYATRFAIPIGCDYTYALSTVLREGRQEDFFEEYEFPPGR